MIAQFIHGYALLIGVNDNQVSGWELPDVKRDIDALAGVLTHSERCAYPSDNVRILVGKDATKENILDGLAWLKDKLEVDESGNETALVYYSGHGWQDDSLSQPAYYLIPYNVDPYNLRETALRADDFSYKITRLDPQRLLVLLDCCHAGGMGVKDIDLLNLTPFSIPPGWFLGGQKVVALEPGAKELDAGLLMQGRGRAVLNSSRSDEKSYLRKDRSMSIFTYHLIEALTGHAPHGSDDKEVTVADLLSHVWRKVPQSAQAEYQAPQHPDGQLSGNFPVALLMGSQGLPEGKSPPDPLAPLPAIKGTGDVSGPILSGQFQGPVHTGQGHQINVGDITASGGNVNIAGGDIHQSIVGGVSSDQITQRFAIVYAAAESQVKLRPDERNDLKADIKELEDAAKKDTPPDESYLARRLRSIQRMAPDILDMIIATFGGPASVIVTTIKKIAEKVKQETKSPAK